MKFVPGKGARINKSQCTIIAAELVRIQDTNKGKLTPELVLQEARSEANPLHNFFEWNTDKAAEKWLLHQAATLIRSVDVVIEIDNKPPVTTRGFISFSDGEGYHSISTILNDDSARTQLIAQAKKEMYDLMKKYQDLEELSSVFEAIKQVAA